MRGWLGITANRFAEAAAPMLAEARRRRRLGRARRALRVAWYWQGKGDLGEAARAAERALRLAGDWGPATLVADVALTLARIAQDRDDNAGCRAYLERAAGVLGPAPAGGDRDRLLGWVLVGLGEERRRAGDFASAGDWLARAWELFDSGDPPEPMLRAAVLTSQGITAKDSGAYDTAEQCYEQVARIQREAGARPMDAAALEHNRAGLSY